MEPHGRDEDQENILEGMIREGDDDVTSLYLNNSGEGDQELDRRDGSGEGEADGSGEGEADCSDEGEADGSDEGEADGSGGTLNITNSGEVHIYIN